MGLKRKLLGVTTGAMLLCSMIGGSVLAAGHVTTGGNLQIEKYVVLDGGSIVPNQKFSFKIEPLDVQPNTKENNLEVKKEKNCRVQMQFSQGSLTRIRRQPMRAERKWQRTQLHNLTLAEFSLSITNRQFTDIKYRKMRDRVQECPMITQNISWTYM